MRNRYRVLIILEVVLILLIHCASIKYFYGFTMSEDELGYWGAAAKFAGLNWGNVLENTSYYSWGYSLVLSLLLRFVHTPIIVYRIGLIMNAVYLVISFLVSTALFNRIFKDTSREIISIVCFVVNLSAGYYVNSKIAWAECFLVMMTWLVLYQAYLIYEKKTVMRQLIFVVELIYVYFVHMRTVPYLVFGIIYLAVVNICDTKTQNRNIKKQAVISAVLVVVLCVLFISGNYLKQYIQANLYGNNNLNNDYSSIISSVGRDSVATTIKKILNEAMGVFFYFYSISFGMIMWGLIEIVIRTKEWIRNREISLAAFNYFAMLLFIGECAVTCVFMRNDGNTSRIDQAIYGRYAEHAMGFLLIYGILKLLYIDKSKRKVFLWQSIFYVVISFIFSLHIKGANCGENIYYQSACAAGLFKIWQKYGLNILYIAGMVLLIGVLLLISTMIKMKTKRYFAYAFLSVIVVSVWLINGRASVSQYALYQGKVKILFDNQNALRDYNAPDEIAFVSDSEYSTRGNVQLYVKDKPIQCLHTDINMDEYSNYKMIITEFTMDQSEFEGQLIDVGYELKSDLGFYKIYKQTN